MQDKKRKQKLKEDEYVIKYESIASQVLPRVSPRARSIALVLSTV